MRCVELGRDAKWGGGRWGGGGWGCKKDLCMASGVRGW